MGCFATGVAVVTARREDGAATGVTVNSLTSLSLDPPLVLFCLDHKAHLYPVFRTAPRFAVNILGVEQEQIARYFADTRHHAKPSNMWDKLRDDCPILRGTLGWMACRMVTVHRGGDHDIFVGEALRLHKRSGARAPLLYVHGRYRKIME